MIIENDSPINGHQKEDGYERQSRLAAGDRRSRISNSTPYTGLGKIPPQAVDVEEIVLGAMMLEQEGRELALEILRPGMMYKDCHQKILNCISLMSVKNEPIDIITITNKLRQLGELEMIGGAYYITELTNRVASAANIEYHCRIIIQKFLQRELIRVSTEVINLAYEDTTDVLELLQHAEKSIFTINMSKGTKKGSCINNLIDERKKQYAIPVVNGLTGIPCGIPEVDMLSHGWQRGNLIIIAARPGMGKTAMALHCAKYCAVQINKPVAVFSLEMSEEQLTDRLVSSESDVLLENIITHQLTPEMITAIDEKCERLYYSDIIIDDTPALNIFEFRSKARRLKSEHGIELIIVDYLQLMDGKMEGRKSNRDEEIGNISRTLKAIAKELNIPVIALSQLSRQVENRAGVSKRPMLSDLRESGNIEQDADQVLFLYRDEYYGITQDANNKSTIGKVEIIFAKNRNGKTGTANADFNGAKMRFRDWNWHAKQQASANFEVRPTDENFPF